MSTSTASTEASAESENSDAESEPSWVPTSDGHERKVSTVKHTTRYGKMERDRALLESGLVDKEGDLRVSGAARGLGGKTRDGNDNRTPERIPGWAILHPDMKYENPMRYRRYDSPFYRSIVGDCTRAVRIPGNDGHDIERRVCAPKLAWYCNKNIFFAEVFGPDELGYVVRKPSTEYEKHLAPSKFGGVISPEGVARAYKVFARLAVMPKMKKLKSQYHGICLICGKVSKRRCDDCDVAVRRAAHHTPLVALTPIVKSAHLIFHRRAANAIVEAMREEVRRVLPFEEEKAEVIIPSAEMLWGDTPARKKYLDFCESTGMVPKQPRLPV